MIRIRKAEERGASRLSWLDSRHTFSFAGYHDPAHMGFRALRVINDDRIAPGAGFATHGHRDMEILTYVIAGALEHRDSLGNGSVIRPGEVQRMSAGTGILHSEFNPSPTEPLHLLQIWILPARSGLPPGYEQRVIPQAERSLRLRVIAAPDGRDGSVTVHQDASLFSGTLAAGDRVAHALAPDRHAWLQVVRGRVTLDDARLDEADGAAVSGENQVRVQAETGAEVLLFDLG